MIRALLVASLLFGGVASAATSSGSKKPTATQKDPKHTAHKSTAHKTTKAKTQKARAKPTKGHAKARTKTKK